MSNKSFFFVSLIMALIAVSAMMIMFNIDRLDKRITQLESALGVTEDWQPEPWMFQPATEECDPDEHWRCWE